MAKHVVELQFAPPVVLNPLRYPAWDSLLATHPESSFFHGAAWARVLHDTYGHQPFYFARLVDGCLKALLPIMEVSSPWTGRRGVSLPFTDWCCPLKGQDDEMRALYQLAIAEGQRRRWQYLECRGGGERWPDACPSIAFYGHALDLAGGTAMLFKSFRGAVRRAIRKAQGAQLRLEFDNSLESVRTFYVLHCRTRQRHGLPPQPFRFFENIARHILEPGHGFITTAWREQTPVAGAVFFQQGRQALYKFGASNHAFQHLRPNNLVMWAGIQRCVADGLTMLHLGRTSIANEGLRRFKLGFGAREERLEYFQHDFVKRTFVTGVDRAQGWLNCLFRRLPPPLLRLAGELLYPHLS